MHGGWLCRSRIGFAMKKGSVKTAQFQRATCKAPRTGAVWIGGFYHATPFPQLLCIL
jgi:hypothetical protein